MGKLKRERGRKENEDDSVSVNKQDLRRDVWFGPWTMIYLTFCSSKCSNKKWNLRHVVQRPGPFILSAELYIALSRRNLPKLTEIDEKCLWNFLNRYRSSWSIMTLGPGERVLIITVVWGWWELPFCTRAQFHHWTHPWLVGVTPSPVGLRRNISVRLFMYLF